MSYKLGWSPYCHSHTTNVALKHHCKSYFLKVLQGFTTINTSGVARHILLSTLLLLLSAACCLLLLLVLLLLLLLVSTRITSWARENHPFLATCIMQNTERCITSYYTIRLPGRT